MKNTNLFLLILILLCCYALPVAAKQYKIALVHSYEEGHIDAARILEILKEELNTRGVNGQFREYYLNCEELNVDAEEERASLFIDDCLNWQADLIAVFDDQATYSLMACNNANLHQIPVVFSGVNYPNQSLLDNYPNITGYVDVPDYLQALRMIENLVGKSRVCVINGLTVLDKMIWKSLNQQCDGQGYDILSVKLMEHVASNRLLQDSLYSIPIGADFVNEKLDVTTVLKVEMDSVSFTDLAFAGLGTHTFFLLTKRDFTTLNSATLFRKFCFATVNEGFGTMDYLIGGYFATLETQLKDMADGIKQRLAGKIPQQQVKQSTKQYVLNWNTLKRYNIPLSSIPEEYVVMYIPFSVRYQLQILYGSILGGIALIGFVFFLARSLSLERRRKREAQRNLQFEHETLLLAIEGGATYAWHLEGEDIIFDTQFNELIKHSSSYFTLPELLTYIHPDEREELFQNFRKMQSKLRHKGQYRCSFSGEYQWWEFRYNTIQTVCTKPVITGLLQNIQDVKDREEELIQARKLAEHAELKQSFLNNMSHEIRTPLNAIAGFSSMLVSNPDLEQEEKQEFADIINNNTNLLLKLVGDVLELSRIESGTLSFKCHKEPLRPILESIYQTHQLLIQPPVKLKKDFPKKDVYVYIDVMRLTQVMTNFLNNAHKFTQEGSIKFGYSYMPETHEVRIFVEDTGIGIPPEEQKMIFERFYKRNEFSQGVGLGLPICTLIVEKLNGRIELKSEVGKGSCFSVILPCAD